MSRRLRLPIALMALGVLLAVVAALTVPARGERTVPGTSTPIGVVADRVAALRGLKSAEPPPVDVVTTSQLRAQAKAAPRADGPDAAADQRALTLLGLLGEGAAPPAPERDAERIAGLYDFVSQRLVVVSDAPPELPAEAILAHELLHALEDQAFDPEPPQADATGDRALAARALLEGTATLIEQRYAQRHLPAAQRRELTRRYAPPGRDPAAFLTNQALFPYIAGPAFVQALLERGDGWQLVDRAVRGRPPTTTEQVLHADKYLDAEPAAPLSLPRPPAGWTQAARGDLGEFATAQLLAGAAARPPHRLSDAAVARAAAGWGNGRYVLWRQERRDGQDDALIARWTWDTRRDAAEFAAAITAVTPSTWGRRRIEAVLRTRDRTTTLVLAADEARGARLLRLLGA